MRTKKQMLALVLLLSMLFALGSCAGKSAYDIAVKNGYPGSESEWLESLKGADGADGAQGIPGIDGENGGPGEKGDQGIQGEKGDKGDQGIQGEKGDKGDQGIQGEKGDKGDQGIQGEKGDQGDQGIQGEKGDKGDQGIQGEKGDQGVAGEDGKSAYQLYCDTYGYEGSEEEWIVDLISGKLMEYTVTFDLNGGVASENYQQSITVPGGCFAPLTIPEREGYTFLGWYTGESAIDGIFTTTTPVKNDVNLIAKWQINTFTVTFLDYYENILKVEQVDYGTAASAPIAPTVDKLYFDAWDQNFSTVTSDLTVKAIYLPNVYTLSYDTNGGTEIVSEVYYVGDIPVKPADPVKTGHYFIGWYLDENYKTKYTFTSNFAVDTTLYACFAESIPIYDAEGLKAMANDTSAKYYLANDIDLNGEVWEPIASFSGLLDGEGHKIHNFIISTSGSEVGFFGRNDGTIQNWTFADFSFSVSLEDNTFVAGAIIGTNNGSIDNCHVTDALLSYSEYIYTKSSSTLISSAGGLVGVNNGAISGCSISAEINGQATIDAYNSTTSKKFIYSWLMLGGITGRNYGTIYDVKASTTVLFSIHSIATDGDATFSNDGEVDARAYLAIGGCVAENYGAISNSAADIIVSPSCSTKQTKEGRAYCILVVGGFVRINEGAIENCRADGSINHTNSNFSYAYLSGFAQYNQKSIQNCYSNVDITSNYATEAIGGFVDYNGGSIVNCYSTGNITGQNNIGGFVGRNMAGGSVTKSYCTGNISAATNTVGYFISSPEDGSSLFKCYYNSSMSVLVGGVETVPANTDGTGATVVTLQSKELLIDTLAWSEDVWTIAMGEYPVLMFEK